MMGSPTEAQQSGFGGERSRKGAGEGLASRRDRISADFAATR